MEDFSYMLDNLKHRLYLQATYEIRLCDYVEGHAYMHDLQPGQDGTAGGAAEELAASDPAKID